MDPRVCPTPLTPNANVYTIHYIGIGHVIADGAKSFHAALPGGPRWLTKDCVYTVEPHLVALLCSVVVSILLNE